MKKVLLAAAAAMFAVAATAQNRAIDALVEKYTDTEGATVVNLDGEALQSMIGMAEGKLNFQGDGENTADFDIDGLREALENIVSVTVIVLDRVDDIFAGEVRNAVSSQKYSPLLSINEEGGAIKVLNMDIERGKYRGNQEMVVSVSDEEDIVLVRVIGKFDRKTISKITDAIRDRAS